MTSASAPPAASRPRNARWWPTLLAFLLAAVAGGAAAIVGWRQFGPRDVTVSAGAFPEELVYARTSDDVINGGAFFSSTGTGRPAVIWIHGWGTSFASPTYTATARALAARGVPTITANTRMHDLGNSATYRNGRRVRGGGYWGITSEQTLDIASWVDFAAQRGFRRVVLVGHSAGWSAVAAYQVTRQDPRVVGLVLASGSVAPGKPDRNPDLLARARTHVQHGAGDDLLRLPNRSVPSFISAGTYADIADTPPALLDFFGVDRRDAGIVQLRRPLLAFFGTRGDVGGQADLDVVQSAPSRLSLSAQPVETTMIGLADHMYTGEEAKVAGVIASWIDRVVTPASTRR
ncbi:MAG TPA: alpha/beta hydrolase [Luteitalea sp.]|nr:alpha/beta hydrolase [Luteitalea sp.]